MSKTANAAVLSEIARLEGDLARIQRELEILRRRVEGTPSGRRTQAFSAVRDAILPQGGPEPSIPVDSETVPTAAATGRRSISQRVSLSDPPPAPQHTTPARRPATPDPAAGRYEFVGEGRSKRR